MKILLPVDGSDYTKRMLGYIAAHDELLGAGNEYIVFTAVAPVPADAARFLDRSTLESYHREQADQVLGPVKRFADQQGWTTRTAHATGRAAEAIAELADAEKVDLIVMGTHGHSALGNVLLGSVASGVLARCRVPVLLVR
jgi:nucleotide-binding universal stress UspA family protein